MPMTSTEAIETYKTSPTFASLVKSFQEILDKGYSSDYVISALTIALIFNEDKKEKEEE